MYHIGSFDIRIVFYASEIHIEEAFNSVISISLEIIILSYHVPPYHKSGTGSQGVVKRN